MTRLFPILLILSLATAFADTLKLKSGEILQGHVISSDAKAVTIEVQFSPTIVDQQTYSRADIADLAVESSDEVAYERIKGIKTPETVLTAATCQALIDKQLAPFLSQYPSSARTTDVQRQMKDIQADLAKLKAGSVKIFGIWYDKASFEAEKYQIEAATLFEAMKQQVAAGNFVAAMNSYDLLQRTYANSVAYAEAVPLASKAVSDLLQQLNLAITNLPQTKAMRQASIDRTPIEQQEPVKQAIAAEDARAAAIAAIAQKNGQRFYTIFPFDEQGLNNMRTAALQAETDLKAVDVKKLASGSKLVFRINQELATRELASAEATLGELKATWPDYEGITRVEQQLQADKNADQASEDKSQTHASPQ